MHRRRDLSFSARRHTQPLPRRARELLGLKPLVAAFGGGVLGVPVDLVEAGVGGARWGGGRRSLGWCWGWVDGLGFGFGFEGLRRGDGGAQRWRGGALDGIFSGRDWSVT